MAKFLTTTGTSSNIEDIIISAQNDLTIVTPYLKLTQLLFERISDADKKGRKITLIYGKNELHEEEKKRLNSFKNIQIYFCKNLHAKCYHNESSMIITSMNLYEFSERNNREMGILIEKNIDTDIFNKALDEIESIKNNSVLEKKYENYKNENKLVYTTDVDDKLIIDLNYKDERNFYLPELSKILKEKYPEKKIVLDKSIKIEKFPFSGMTLEVDGRIDILFSTRLPYDYLKKVNRNLGKGMPNIRFYWNYFQLNVYVEKDFKVEMNKEGLSKALDKYIQIIDYLYDKIVIN